VGAYNNLIQYDYSSKGLPFNTLINSTLSENGGDHLKVLDIAIKLSNAQNDLDCLTWDPRGVRTFTTIPFQYMICTYLPYTAGLYSTADSIWGSVPRKCCSAPYLVFCYWERASQMAKVVLSNS
jgi:hypothetical protein